MIDSDSPGNYVDYDLSIVSCFVGIDEQSSPTSFFISPNPSNGIFTLQANIAGEANILLTNILGEKILEQKIVSDKTEINLNNQPNGIYFVIVTDKNKSKIMKKLVKM